MNSAKPGSFRRVIDPALCQKRLRLIFPPAATDAVLSGPLAAKAVAAMIYAGAVVNDSGEPVPENVWARPQTVLSMSDEALARPGQSDRLAWSKAAAGGNRKLATLLEMWGEGYHPWYEANTREGLRDEIWPRWRDQNAVRTNPDVSGTSAAPRWALTASFADLFAPDLDGPELTAAIDSWRDTHMAPGDLFKILSLNKIAQKERQVSVEIPGYGTRYLEPGTASHILKGVIEEWAPRRLGSYAVVAISEPGTKIWSLDAAGMAAVGISINVSRLLPDAIILDIQAEPPIFWIVEAVATDGEINEGRKEDLLMWARDQYIDPVQCQFLSAFSSRNSAPARKRLKDIAAGTYCWFLDEPDQELAWYELPGKG